MPKSTSFAFMFSSKRMLSGFTSPWKSPTFSAASRPSAISIPTRSTKAGSRTVLSAMNVPRSPPGTSSISRYGLSPSLPKE